MENKITNEELAKMIKDGFAAVDDLAIMVKNGFDAVDHRFDKVEGDITEIKSVLENRVRRHEFDALDRRVDGLELKVKALN